MIDLIFNALVILGIWESSAPGMILNWPASWLRKRIGDYWIKPVCECPPCMASAWGLLYYFLGRYFKPLWYILALCGLVKIIIRVAFRENPVHKEA